MNIQEQTFTILNNYRNAHNMYRGRAGTLANMVAHINCDHGKWYAQRAHYDGTTLCLDGPRAYMSRTDVMDGNRVADTLGIV